MGTGRGQQRQRRRVQRHQRHATGVRTEAYLQCSHCRRLHCRHGQRHVPLRPENTCRGGRSRICRLLLAAIEQYVECTHEYWRSNGQFTPNLTLRLASGGYIGGGLYHSQTIEGALTSIPGARIVYPSFADDAAGLLRTSIRSKGFTVFLEPKAQYNSVEAAGFVPEDFEVPFGKARIRRPGSDLSVITYGNTTHFCLSVAERLKKEHNWDVEVIDIRSLIPLDTETIFASVKKTGKVLIVHEDKVFSGFGAEIAGIVGTEMFRYLDAPIQRVGSTFTPVGFHPVLEKAILPGEERIYNAAKALLEY